MKLLTVAVPAYNAAGHMDTAIKSLLDGGDRIEIIIVNDGSSDDTLDKALKYVDDYPDIVKVVDQENKGHGGAVNAGLAEATGLYFRVLDSDDWVRKEGLERLLATIKDISDQDVDMILTNFQYFNVDDDGRVKKKRLMSYNKEIPSGKVIGWEDISNFKMSNYILMHSITYRTALLRDINFELPEKTFYVDNIFAFIPLLSVEKIYYLNELLYIYKTGCNQQSVNMSNMAKNILNQLAVTDKMIEFLSGAEVDSEKQYNYMKHYLSLIMLVSSVVLDRIYVKNNYKIKKSLGNRELAKRASANKKLMWTKLQRRDPKLYKSISRSVIGLTSRARGPLKTVTVFGYELGNKIAGWN